MWRSRIKRELGGKKICCFMCPLSWSTVADIEQEQLNDEGRIMDFKSGVKA